MVSLVVSLLLQTVDHDIVYSTISGKDLKLDAYRPKDPIGKVFIAIHGGGFVGGAKGGDTAAICQYLSSRGFTCFDIDYRLQSDVGGTIQDAMKAAQADTVVAYNWVVKHAKEYGGNPDKISIGGSSAGAITALAVTYIKRLPVKSVVDLWGGMYGNEKELRKGDPPVLIVHGTADRIVPFVQAQNLANQAKMAGVKYRFLKTNGGHSMNLRTEIDHYTILEHIDSFLRETQ
ncbi:MAG: alpha/beta hydrolase fold domain-containing protein [Armatimonadetes bacterium]|nr:alpha/beta hydrolase fold domain-containing protein [Armatimonadota bacterium]MBS1701526.1 alpha/beta hydrolase fold domain-containing protein [Armatimonadota bacterium]MBS1725731.1 alpha/beta hydrolase fold domain-containing protein [Armatimonadota bacterium]